MPFVQPKGTGRRNDREDPRGWLTFARDPGEAHGIDSWLASKR